MNLYKIAIGPYHHDFSLLDDSKKDSRLQFDLKISQYIETAVECQLAEVEFKTKYPG